MRFGGHPVGPEHPGQQQLGLLGGEHVEADPAGAGAESGQRVAAGDQRQAAGAAGQQRAYLLGAGRVVQHHQDAPVGQQVAVQRGRLVHAGRYPVGRYPERPQEPGQRVDRPDRRGGGEPAQVHEQLPVRELVADPVRPVHGQCRLAGPGGTRDGGDDHRVGLLAVGQEPVQPVEVVDPAGEAEHV